MKILENTILGLDLGYASIGWALLEENPVTSELRIVTKITKQGEVLCGIGSRLIDAPENAKTKELLNVERRQKRSARRVIARRSQRMRAIKRLFAECGLVINGNTEDFYHIKGKQQRSPWELRVRGLKEILLPEEFAIVLYHLAKHRGFRSNSKTQRDDSGGLMKRAISENEEMLKASGCSTMAEYFCLEEREGMSKRNRANFNGEAQYSNTIQRKAQEAEVKLLFDKQREFGNIFATEELESKYTELAFEQRELKSVANMVGNCLFLSEEKRAPAFAPTAEYFRFLQKTVNLRLLENGVSRPLKADEFKRVLSLFGTAESINYIDLRKNLLLSPAIEFDGLSPEYDKKGKRNFKEEHQDVVRRTGKACAGTFALKKCLGEEIYRELTQRVTDTEDFYPGMPIIDRIAKVLCDNNGFEGIRKDISNLEISEEIKSKVIASAEHGDFNAFKGTMHLSIKAMCRIIPFMEQQMRYDEACTEAGFCHYDEAEIDINDIRNPVVQHLFREMRKQIHAIVHTFGFWPGRVHIELLREVGKSPQERNDIDAGIKKRTGEKQRLKEELMEKWGREVTGSEVRRYELWKQQNEFDAYAFLRGENEVGYRGSHSGKIELDWLKDTENRVQIDHILPRSRTFDNSFNNQCLCLSSSNQAKLNRTPYEWIGKNNPEAWHSYTVWINSLKISQRKKRTFLRQNLDEVQEKFMERNKTDSAYISKLAANWFRKEYSRLLQKSPDDQKKKRRVFTRSGSITSFLRHIWGVETIKKVDGRRIGDQHHALDAVIVACCTEAMLQQTIDTFKCRENNIKVDFPKPWEGFREEMTKRIEEVSVSREVKKCVSGALHEETLRSIQYEKINGKLEKVLYERRWVNNIKVEDIPNIKDPERCPNLIEALTLWLQQDKKSRGPLIDPTNGKEVRHLKVRRGEFSSGVEIKRGSGKAQADNGEMARVDVYTKAGKFYLVPVYLKDIADGILPVRICKAKTRLADRPRADSSYNFVFSLRKNDFVVIENPRGDVSEGYYYTTQISVGALEIRKQFDRNELVVRGVLNLTRFEKYQIDRMGRRIPAQPEKDPRQK